MFRKLLLACCIFLLTVARLTGQDLTITTYTHQLLFNVLTDEPDTSISGFLKLYIPSLYNKKKATVGPATDTFHYHEEIHSFLFTKHPFLNIKFAKGKLDIYCKRYDGPELIQHITNVQLLFEFDEPQEAEIAFSRLVDNFILLSNDKKFSTVNGAQKAEFTNSRITNGFNRVQFRLAADNIGQHRYKLLFETGDNL